MANMQTRILAYGVRLEHALLGGNTVDMHGTVAALGGDELVHRIPGDALYIVSVFRELTDAGPIRDAKDASGIICTASNNVFARRAPSEIINFIGRATVPAHG
jgi:hypothetical protein